MREPERKAVIAPEEKTGETLLLPLATSSAADHDALDEVFGLVYEELWRLASAIRKRDPRAT